MLFKRRQCGVFLEFNKSGKIPPDADTVFVDASKNSVEITLPEVQNYQYLLSIVCISNECGITIRADNNSSILDEKNVILQYPGDSITLRSNREDTWFCIAKYSVDWYS